MVPQARFELAFKFLLLRETTLPICLLGRLVQPLGIEPSSPVLRTGAITISAKVANGATRWIRTTPVRIMSSRHSLYAIVANYDKWYHWRDSNSHRTL
jgi:hypothetical protein